MSIIGNNKEHITSVCKIGQGSSCCSYLGAGTQGMECLKESSLKAQIDKRREAGVMVAMSDNCKGFLAENSGEKIYESKEDGPWGHKLCRCSACSTVERCRPSFDFYVTKDQKGFVCESCFKENLMADGITPMF